MKIPRLGNSAQNYPLATQNKEKATSHLAQNKNIAEPRLSIEKTPAKKDNGLNHTSNPNDVSRTNATEVEISQEAQRIHAVEQMALNLQSQATTSSISVEINDNGVKAEIGKPDAASQSVGIIEKFLDWLSRKS